MHGASEFEKRYGRERCRRRSMISRATRRVAARRAAQRLAERSGEDVDAALDAAEFRRAAPACADESDGVRIVDHHQRVVRVGEIADRSQIGDDAVHREHAVGRDQLEARAGGVGLGELRFEIRHVVVAIAVALRLAEPDAVDDARVIQFVADDGVLFAQQRLEQPAVRVEAARVEDGVVGAEERGERRFERRVHALRAADEAHRRHPVAVPVETVARGGDEPRIVGESEVVVGAEIDDRGAARELDLRRLRRADDALLLVEAVGANLIEHAAQMSEVGVVHRMILSAGTGKRTAENPHDSGRTRPAPAGGPKSDRTADRRPPPRRAARRSCVVGEIGDRPRHLQDAVIRARRQREPRHRLREQRRARGIGRAMGFDLARAEPRVRLALARHLPRARARHLAHVRARSSPVAIALGGAPPHRQRLRRRARAPRCRDRCGRCSGPEMRLR